MSSSVLKPDLCIIGAGSGGLSVAAGAAQMGASVVLIEKGEMGGDCLNTGCVPSKALLAAAHQAHAQTTGAPFGVQPVSPQVDFAAVMDHVAGVISTIAPIDSVERFEGLGCTVIKAEARFTGPREVEAGGQKIRARRFVVATGSHAFVPPIPGLADVPFFTNENIFQNRTQPDHLLIIGAGPIGLEMAQAHARLGSKVTVLEAARALPKDDAELAAIVLTRLRAEGIDIREGAGVTRAEKTDSGVTLHLDGGDVIEGSHILVAAGRRPVVDGLGLKEAGIETTPAGIKVNAGLRTTNARAYAIGDVAGGPQFTHMAGYHAGIVIRSALFRAPAKVALNAVPWVTYTDPELAQVGLTESAAIQAGHKIRVVDWSFEENDRAQAEHRTEGKIKVVCAANGKILGAGIAGPHAGELIQPWIMAITHGMKIGAMTSPIAPYPTLGEVSKRAAGAWYTPTLFSPRTRWLVKLLSKLG